MEEEKKVEEVKVEKKRKSLVTSRVLFISALDKIFLVILLLMFIGATFANFEGDISSISYGFWERVGTEIVIIIVMFIYYLFLNWIYKCAAKTMLCLTENEVYKESYVPFRRSETSIPLNKITGITTHNLFWIFRVIIIHQYGKLPMVFATWNNQEFKDKLNELITTEKEKIENEYEDRNIISKNMYKYLKYLGIVLGVIIGLIAIVRFFTFVFNGERKIAGTYSYLERDIVLEKDGTCNIDDISDENITECSWSYDKDDKEVEIDYSYRYYSYYYGYKTIDGNTDLKYDKDNKTLTYGSLVYKKK